MADPYRALLDTRVTQLPPEAYALLGLEAIEFDSETIHLAATRKRSVLHSRRHIVDTRQWQLVNSQLEQAIATLTDQQRKEQYDQQLVEEGRAEMPLGESILMEESPVVVDAIDIRGREEVQCRGCGTLGKSNGKYCGNCGDPLWEPCPKCGTLESSSQKFCGNCGINRLEAIDALLAQCISDLEQADRMRKRGDFEAASTLLSQLAEKQHPLTIPYAQEAKALLSDMVVEQEQRTEEALQAVAAAESLFAEQDYDSARCALESIPPAMRNERTKRLLDEVQAVSEEATSLNLAIRKGLDRKNYEGMLEQVTRLLELQPTRTDMQKLLGQLEKRDKKHRKKRLVGLVQQAKEMIAAQNYAEAVHRLEQVADSEQTEEVQQLYEQAKELFWLKDDLRRSPVSDPALLGIAKRLIKFQPEDKGAGDLIKELTRRTQSLPEDPRCAYHYWAKPTGAQKLGLPVQLLGWSQSIESKEAPNSTRQVIAQNPGRLQTACGLALQGLGQASVVTDLTPRDGGVMGRWTRRMRRPKSPTAWGIDIGTSHLKAVLLELPERTQPVRILDAVVIPHEQNLRRVGMSGDWAAEVSRTLQAFSQQHDLNVSRLCVGFPGAKVLTRFVQLPPMPEKKLQEAIQYEARHQIPFDLSSLVWDSHVIRHGQEDSGLDDSRSVVLIAAKTGQLREYVDLFQDLGLCVDLLQCDCVALHNFLIHEYYSQERVAQSEHEDTLPVTAAIDIGSHSSNLVLSGPEMVWFRSVDLGSEHFNSALIQKFKLTHDTAEKLKRNPLASRSIHKWDEALQPAMKDLLKEVRLSLGAYESDHKQTPIRQILGLGGGFHLHGLLRFFNSVESKPLVQCHLS